MNPAAPVPSPSAIARAALPRSGRTLVALTAVLIVSMVVGLMCGPGGVGFPAAELLELRLLRVLLAALLGAGLAATGAALQALLANPLADPYVLGVSGGAAMGAASAVALAESGLIGSGVLASALLPGAGAVGALLATLFLVWFIAKDARPQTPLLLGVVLNAFAWAAVAVVRALLPADSAQTLGNWLLGSVGYPTPIGLFIAFAMSAAAFAMLMVVVGPLSLLALGADEAERLGVDVARVRLWVYLSTSLLVGVAVSNAGVIGFVGLIAPHACRLLFGRDERLLLPAATLLGGAALVLFDGAARLSFVFAQTEIPAGALTACVGAPAFAIAFARRAHRSAR